MEIIIGLILAFVAIIVIGKIKGPPDPATMSLEAILARMQSEGAWIERYKALPYEYQQGAGIKKQYEGKKLYIMQLNLEFMKRGLEMSGKKSDETLISVLQRSIELMKNGMSQEEAQKKATEEFVAKRDAVKADQPETTP
jgi:hypothetical protein